MVTQAFIQPLLHVLIILPLLLIFIKDRTRNNYFRVLSITFCYYIYCIFLFMPHLVDSFHIINGNWNWNGKIYGILSGIAIYFIFRQQFNDNDFFTLKQNKEGLKAALKVSCALISIFSLSGILGVKEFNLETLLFQITMPGIDEEIMFRGILLGLMCSALRNTNKAYKNPAIIINGILFGLAHSLIFQNGKVAFNTGAFIGTGMIGYALAYITIKTRSILIPMLTHNISNFLKNLFSMI